MSPVQTYCSVDSLEFTAPGALQNVTFNSIPCLSSLPELDDAPAPSPETEQPALAAFFNASQSVSDGLFIQYTPVGTTCRCSGSHLQRLPHPGSCFRPHVISLASQQRPALPCQPNPALVQWELVESSISQCTSGVVSAQLVCIPLLLFYFWSRTCKEANRLSLLRICSLQSALCKPSLKGLPCAGRIHRPPGRHTRFHSDADQVRVPCSCCD